MQAGRVGAFTGAHQPYEVQEFSRPELKLAYGEYGGYQAWGLCCGPELLERYRDRYPWDKVLSHQCHGACRSRQGHAYRPDLRSGAGGSLDG